MARDGERGQWWDTVLCFHLPGVAPGSRRVWTLAVGTR